MVGVRCPPRGPRSCLFACFTAEAVFTEIKVWAHAECPASGQEAQMENRRGSQGPSQVSEIPSTYCLSPSSSCISSWLAACHGPPRSAPPESSHEGSLAGSIYCLHEASRPAESSGSAKVSGEVEAAPPAVPFRAYLSSNLGSVIQKQREGGLARLFAPLPLPSVCSSLFPFPSCSTLLVAPRLPELPGR